MTDVLRVAEVSLTRGETLVLNDVTWTVRPGERWVILGPNGAGKTSLLTLISARSHPTTGDITVLGVPVTEASIQELRTRVGLSSDALAVAIARHAVVRDVVLTAAHGVTARQREGYEAIDLGRAEALLEAFGLAGLATREFGTLSEGERKRAQLARSLMANPEILLLDEPAAGLDLAGREELLEALTHLAADPRAPVLILVTHHVEEIPRGFTHALVLARGAVVASGPLEDILTAETLSRAYGIPVDLDRADGRYAARRRPA